MRRDKTLLIAVAGLLAAVAATGAPPTGTAAAPPATKPAPAAGHIMLNDADLKWSPAGMLPAGAEMAVLEGDPSQPGLFTVRLRVPASYGIPPHTHPGDEHITVISGALWMGTGDKLDETSAHEIKAGGYAVMPAPTRHFAFFRGPTVVQLHGMGPFGITYVNPADDPRKAPATAAAPVKR